MSTSRLSSIIIRTYKPSDYSACLALFLASHRDNGNTLPNLVHDIEYDLDNIEKKYLKISNANWFLAVTKDDNRIVGQQAIQPLRFALPNYYEELPMEERDQICELSRLTVASDMQRLGIGSLLFLTALNFAREKEYRQAHFVTLANMKKTHWLFEKHACQKGRLERFILEQGGRSRYEREKKDNLNYNHPPPVVFDVGEVVPDEDLQRIKLPPTKAQFVYIQHYFCKLY